MDAIRINIERDSVNIDYDLKTFLEEDITPCVNTNLLGINVEGMADPEGVKNYFLQEASAVIQSLLACPPEFRISYGRKLYFLCIDAGTGLKFLITQFNKIHHWRENNPGSDQYHGGTNLAEKCAEFLCQLEEVKIAIKACMVSDDTLTKMQGMLRDIQNEHERLSGDIVKTVEQRKEQIDRKITVAEGQVKNWRTVLIASILLMIATVFFVVFCMDFHTGPEASKTDKTLNFFSGLSQRVLLVSVPLILLKISLTKFTQERKLVVTYQYRNDALDIFTSFYNSNLKEEHVNAMRLSLTNFIFSDPNLYDERNPNTSYQFTTNVPSGPS